MVSLYFLSIYIRPTKYFALTGTNTSPIEVYPSQLGFAVVKMESKAKKYEQLVDSVKTHLELTEMYHSDSATNSKSSQIEIDATFDEIDKKQNELDEQQKKLDDNHKESDDNYKELESTQKLLDKILSKIKSLQSNQKTLESGKKSLETDMKKLQKKLKEKCNSKKAHDPEVLYKKIVESNMDFRNENFPISK